MFTPRIGLAYSKIEYPDVHHVLNEVKQAGGIAVIAHPGQLKDISLLEQLADRKEIDGIEAVSYTHLDVYKRQGKGYIEKEQFEKICQYHKMCIRDSNRSSERRAGSAGNLR